MTKICILCYKARPDTASGVDKYTYELISHLKHKVDLTIVERGNARQLWKESLDQLLYLFKIGRKSAHLYHLMAPTFAPVCSILKKRPLVTTIHDTLPYELPYEYPLGFSYARFSIDMAFKSDKVIVSSYRTRKVLMNLLSVSDEKIKVVHMGVDHSKFFPMPNIQKRKKLRERRVILYMGWVSGDKGVECLLRAFKVVKEELGNSELLIGGKGNIRFFANMARLLDLENSVRFLGFIPEKELPYYYNSADVFVFPSSLGLGLMLLDAMACGTPVIAGSTFDTPEYVEEAGLLVKPGDEEGLADALLMVLIDNKLKTTLSLKAIHQARKFSWEKTANETLKVYQEFMPDCNIMKL